eukprot:2529696-Prymnesium_polylepis.1
MASSATAFSFAARSTADTTGPPRARITSKRCSARHTAAHSAWHAQPLQPHAARRAIAVADQWCAHVVGGTSACGGAHLAHPPPHGQRQVHGHLDDPHLRLQARRVQTLVCRRGEKDQPLADQVLLTLQTQRLHQPRHPRRRPFVVQLRRAIHLQAYLIVAEERQQLTTVGEARLSHLGHLQKPGKRHLLLHVLLVPRERLELLVGLQAADVVWRRRAQLPQQLLDRLAEVASHRRLLRRDRRTRAARREPPARALRRRRHAQSVRLVRRQLLQLRKPRVLLEQQVHLRGELRLVHRNKAVNVVRHLPRVVDDAERLVGALPRPHVPARALAKPLVQRLQHIRIRAATRLARIVEQPKDAARRLRDERQHVRVVAVVDQLPLDTLAHVHLLLQLDHVLDEHVVQQLIREVDAQLREAVPRKALEAKDVE